MGFDILDLMEKQQVDLSANRQHLSGLMAAHFIAVIDGKLYNLGEYPAPLANLIGFGYELPETIPPSRIFPIFLHDLRCTGEGFEGAVCCPATRIVDGVQTLWHLPTGASWVHLVGWQDWLRAHGMLCVGLRGLDAWQALISFRAWAAPLNSATVIEWHREAGGQLPDYVALSPDVAGQTSLLEYAAELSLGGGGKSRGRGKRGRSQKGRDGVDVRRSVIELAALAGHIRARDSLSSWDKAYEAACLERPDWVPPTWSDPVKRLNSEVRNLGSRWAMVREKAS